MDHPYPDHAYLERDAETDEKRWYSCKGMGVRYVHEDRVAEEVEAAIKAERDRCERMVKPLPLPDDFASGRQSRDDTIARLAELNATISDEIIQGQTFFALLYMTSEVHEGGSVRVWPAVHGFYETYEDAERARKSKMHPDRYYVRNAHKRRVI